MKSEVSGINSALLHLSFRWITLLVQENLWRDLTRLLSVAKSKSVDCLFEMSLHPVELIQGHIILWLQIFLLLFLLLYISSYALISRFRRTDRDDYLSVDEDEAMVYRISLWLCSVSLAVSIGATLLLPLSIASNEVLILYPNSYYVKWLNSSLIQGNLKYIKKSYR